MRQLVIFLVILWCSPIPAFCQTNPYGDSSNVSIPNGSPGSAVAPGVPLITGTPEATATESRLMSLLAKFNDLMKARDYYGAAQVVATIEEEGKVVTAKKVKKILPGIQSKVAELRGRLSTLRDQLTAECAAKLLKAARNHEGFDSSKGPGGGDVACAWMVSSVLRAAGMVPAGWEELGARELTRRMQEEFGWKKITPSKGKTMKASQMKPGDIVFWDPNDHVGVYLGNGQAFSNSSSDHEGKIHPVSGYYDGWVPRFTVRLRGV